MNTSTWFAIQGPAVLEILVVAILFGLMPSITRPSLFFAVTVDPALRRTPGGKATVRRYRAIVIAGAVLSLAETLWIPGLDRPDRVWIPMVTVLAAGIGAFLDARRRVLPHAAVPDPEREAVLAPHRDRFPGGWPAQASPFILLAAAGAWLGAHWQRIPARFPIHWNIAGQPNGWASRSAWGVFSVLGLGAAVCLFLLLVSIDIVRWSRRVHAAGREGAAERSFRRLILATILGAELMIAAITAWIGISPVIGLHNPALTAQLIVAASTIGMIIVVVLLIRAGQGGSHLTGQVEERPEGDRSEDRFWTLGLFYVNPDDPAVFVEKRFGIGYTLNFGNRWVWGTLLALTALALLSLVFSALV